MAMSNLNDLLVHFVRDMYYAEKQILKELPKMARKAHSKELKELFEEHREETEGQIERLEKVFEELGLKARGVTCEAIQGILDEGKEIMQETSDDDTRDAGMIAAAQAVEHYEITRYGTMITWADRLGLDKARKLLAETLEQEKAADGKLTRLAEQSLNKKAA